jgi:protein xylosyltransferase
MYLSFLECDNYMWNLGHKRLPNGIMFEGGSDWMVFTKDFVSYVTNGKDELLNGLKTVFSYTAHPNEAFFHTVLRNSKFCSSYVNKESHLVNWKLDHGCRIDQCHKKYGDFCGCSPNGKLYSLSKLVTGQVER